MTSQRAGFSTCSTTRWRTGRPGSARPGQPGGGLPLEAFIGYDEAVADEEQGFRIVLVPISEDG